MKKIMKNFKLSILSIVIISLCPGIFQMPASQTTIQARPAKRPSVAQAVTPRPDPLDSTLLMSRLDSVIVPGLEKYRIPGMIVVIVRDSNLVFAKGYGYADVERKIPFDPDSTVIRIASVSKLFTATAVLQLVDRGVLNMYQDINSYLTRFKVEKMPGMPITLHNLLTHTAGFDDQNIGKSAWKQEDQIPLGDFLATHLPQRICPPGEVYVYSNISNALAGFIVEETAHEDYAAYVRQNILEPLGMKKSDYRLRPDLEPSLAQCYSHDGAGFRHEPFDFINDYPGGQMLSTGMDMAKFMIAHLQLGQYAGKRILSKESALAMRTTQFIHHKELEHSVGYGFGIVPAKSRTILMHDGGYTGIGCRFCLDPESGIGFFAACNIMDGRLLDEVSRKILDRFIPDLPPDSTKYPITALPQYDKDIVKFAGTYRLSRYNHSNVTKMGVLIGMSGPELKIRKNEEGMILMDTYNGKTRRMIQIKSCLFQSIDDKFKCAFRKDESGKVTHLFTDGNTAFEKLAWFETTSFQRSLLAFCLLYFIFASVALPIVRRIRKTRKPAGPSIDPIRWLSQKTASTFLIYVLALGIVMGFVIPGNEISLGFAHGMHWTAYIVQTIALLGILFLAVLICLLLWRSIKRSYANAGERVQSFGLGLATAITGVLFVWFLWYWNLIGYQF